MLLTQGQILGKPTDLFVIPNVRLQQSISGAVYYIIKSFLITRNLNLADNDLRDSVCASPCS